MISVGKSPRGPQCIGESIGPLQDQDVQMLPCIAR